MRNQVFGDFGRAAHIVGRDAIAFLGAPIADDIVSHHGEGNSLFAKRGKNTDGMRAAQDYAAGPVCSGQGRGQAEIGGRSIEVATEGDELEIPTVLCAIAFRAQQDLGLKFVDGVAISEDESDGAILAIEG